MIKKSKLALGSAQWGMNYGISNNHGKSTSSQINKILTCAKKYNIKLIDTAFNYGEAEIELGKNDLSNFNIISKTPFYEDSLLTKNNKKDLLLSFHNSLSRLNLTKIHCILIHHAEDLLKEGSEYLIEALYELKEKKVVSKIGFSMYPGIDLDKLLKNFTPDIVQLPINILDQRLLKDGTIKYLKSLDIEIHARSIFLQGLLLIKSDDISSDFHKWKPILKEWELLCNDLKCTPLKLALNFVCNLDCIDFVVVGVQNVLQLKQIISSLDPAQKIKMDKFASNETKLIDPTNWKIS